MTGQWFNAAEIAAMDIPGLPTTQRRIKDRAARDCWEERPRRAERGGVEYHTTSLPLEARQELARRHLQEVHPSPLDVVPDEQLKTAQTGLARLAETNGAARDRAETKLALIATFEAWRKVSGLAVKPARTAFAMLWNERQIPAPDALYSAIPQTSDSTLRRIQQQLGSEGAARLGGNQGKHRKGAGVIDSDEDLRQLILGMIKLYPKADGQAKKIMRALRARESQFEKLPSFRSVQRWLQNHRNQFKQEHLAHSNPDAWRSTYMAASGSASEGIEVMNQLWELDSTPGDVILADGKRHALIGAIDVKTRQLKVLVSRTSNSAAIAALTRNCLLDWGVPKKVKTDQGADYTSVSTRAVFESLDVDQELCPPFSPWLKPHIERAFRTLLHGLFELLPGYVGHDVVERQSIEARNSFAERMMNRKEKQSVTIGALTADELQDLCDRWISHVYEREPHGGLNGMTPFEAAAAETGPVLRIEDERALDVLLLPVAQGSGWRQVQKKGISVEAIHFDAPELGGYEGQTVRVLLDQADASAIYVFEEAGPFICRAVAPERAGVSRTEISQKRKANQQKKIKEFKSELRRAASNARVDDIVGEILADAKNRADTVTPFPKPAIAHTTPEIEEAGRAARVHEAPLAEIHTLPERAADKPVAGERTVFASDVDYAAWLIGNPDQVTSEDRDYFRGALRTQRIRMLFDAHGIDAETLHDLLERKDARTIRTDGERASVS
ncbi:Mu transposase C-terminal domain-containing protein [Martelella sp. UBA3392]|uniref:Mu transposase C-terminal domain-containing protein n=1 Tax=Martelella sp. UBA3392 TaxID=1946834 RepID=UPI0031F48BD3|tara:strand:+ start:1209 stop:3395 length:2187 start_codon:yes stop_codon:yes gene_type:complete